MALIVNSSQFLRKGVTYPRGVYSRQIGTVCTLAGFMQSAYSFTMPMGGSVWLLKVKVWFVPVYPAPGGFVDFWVRSGTGKPDSYAAMSNWTDILPITWYLGSPTSWRDYDTGQVFEWTMNRHFTGEAIRFGIQMYNYGLNVPREMYASFEISEG
jgi:hypothetical protein